jgi:glycosyltransferase involved in cell wall biosynthesis
METNSSTTPLVSIILATYNRAHLIGESIRSVLNQTYGNWELIIVDDGSDDQTADVVKQLHDARVKYSYVLHTGMLGAVRNLGIRKAKGEFIAFQDSDDIWREDKLAIQLQLFNKYPDAFFGLSNNNQFGENAVHPPEYEDFFVGNLFSPFLNQNRFHFCGTSLIFKTAVLQKIGMLEETQPRMRELDFFLRMSHEFKGVFTNERLVNVRRHDHNTSNTYSVDAHWCMIDMLKDFHQKGLISTGEFRHHVGSCYYKIGLYYAKQKKPKLAWPHFVKLIRLRPLYFKGWVRAGEAAISSIYSLLDKRTAAP